jgi:hypothetical protein
VSRIDAERPPFGSWRVFDISLVGGDTDGCHSHHRDTGVLRHPLMVLSGACGWVGWSVGTLGPWLVGGLSTEPDDPPG